MPLPNGVPSPYVTHIHPYPTRFHGGIWRRPAFGLPYVRQPFNVLRPSQMAGLGHWDTGTGVFRRPAADGGGIFNNISGLGDDLSPQTKMFLAGGVISFGLIVFLMSRKKKGMTPNRSCSCHKKNGADLAGAKRYVKSYYGSGSQAVPPPFYWPSSLKRGLQALYGVTPDDFSKLTPNRRRRRRRRK